MMSNSKNDQTIKLSYDNWYLWDHHINSTIRQKNASVALDPEPVDPRTTQQTTTVATAGTPSASGTSQPSTTPVPTADKLKTYQDELKEWKTANNIAAGVILGTLSEEIQHVIDPKESAKVCTTNCKLLSLNNQVEAVHSESESHSLTTNSMTHRQWTTLKNISPSTAQRTPPSTLF